MQARTLVDLLHKFDQDPKIPRRRKSMTKTAASHASKALGFDSPAQVPVHRVFAAERALTTYLEMLPLSHLSRRNYKSFFSRFLRWCQDQKLLPRQLAKDLTPAWHGLTHPLKGASSGRKGWRDGLRKLAQWCSGFGIEPTTLTTDDVRGFAKFMEHESGVDAWRQVYNRGSREWKLHESEGRAPELIWYKLPTSARSKYAFNFDEWPSTMRSDYARYRKFCVKKFSLEREPQYGQRENTADHNLECLERIAGFATGIHGIERSELNFDIFLNKEIIVSYFEWMIEHRLGGVPTGYLERLAGQLAAMTRGYYKEKGPLEWLLPLKIRVKSEPVRNKRPLLLSIDELDKVPEGIRSLRLGILDRASKGNRIASSLKQAQLVRAELVFSILNRRPLRQKNLREIEIGRNLVEIAPNKYYLRFSGEEMKNGYSYEISFPDDIVPLLQDYLTNYRQILCNGRENNYLFPNPHGGHICDRTVQSIVGRHTRRVLGKHMHPHLIRDCVAHWLIKQDPGNVLMVSKLLGHRDIRTTIAIYCNLEPSDAAEFYDALRLKKAG